MINLVILKTEFKINLKLVVIWTLIFAILIMITLALFDTIRAQQASFTGILNTMPTELLKAFNINNDTYSTIEGYFSSEDLSLFLLAFCTLAVYLGSTTIGKEISNRTITFLVTKPLSRMQIYISKTVAAIALLLAGNTAMAAITFIVTRTLTSDHSASPRFFIVIFATAWLMQLIFLGLGQFLSLLLNDSQAFLLGIGAVFGFWIIDIISALPGLPSFIQFLTPFHYIGALDIKLTHEFSATHIVALAIVALASFIVSAWVFRRRDFEA